MMGEAQEIRAQFPGMGEAPPYIGPGRHAAQVQIVLVDAGDARECGDAVDRDAPAAAQLGRARPARRRSP